MKFEFAKYTDVTELAFKVNVEYRNNPYVKVYICEDTRVFWISRILKGFNEEYEVCPDMYLVERERIDKDVRSETLYAGKARRILESDELEGWDGHAYHSLEEAIESIDGGYGLN